MTVSESTRDDLVDWNIPKGNIAVIHNGFNKVQVSKKHINKETKKTAIYLGALSEDKGVFDAVYAFSEINRKDEDWQLWVVGRSGSELDKKLRSLILSLGLKEKIKIFGFVTDKKKYELLARSHILINPSIREGWGLVNIEANSVGTPVIGYDVPGMKDSVVNRKTGILVRVGNYKLIAEEALKLLKDQALYKHIVQNSKKWAEKFSWNKSTKDSLEFIESL